jgi:hypothetical protein
MPTVVVDRFKKPAELIGTLSLAVDTGTGLPDCHALRGAARAGLARELKADERTAQDVFHLFEDEVADFVQRLVDRVRPAVHDIDVSRHLLTVMSTEAASSGNALTCACTPAASVLRCHSPAYELASQYEAIGSK